MDDLRLGARPSVRIAVVLLLGALFIFAFPFWSLPNGDLSGPDAGFLQYNDSDWGEVLLHGVQLENRSVSFYMPGRSILSTVLVHWNTPSTYKLCRLLFVTVAIGLVLSLGCLLGAPLGTLLAVGLALLSAEVRWVLWYFIFNVQYLTISLLVAMVASVLVWRAQAPTVGRSLVLGLSIGAVLLYRSSLVLFPFLLAFYEFIFVYKKSIKSCWKHLVSLCVVPYLFLIPWIVMNWIVHRQIIPFEHNEAAPNIVRGALGFVFNTESYWKWPALVDEAVNIEHMPSLLRWAAGEVFGHPLRYFRGYAERIGHAMLFYPALLPAVWALWVYRTRRDVQELGLFLFYFIGIHTLMTFQENYLWPIWPLLIALSALLAGYFWNGGRVEKDGLPYRFSTGFMHGCLAGALVFSLFLIRTVSSFASQALRRPPLSDQAWADALARAPDDAWLLFQTGERKLEKGDLAGAIEDLSRSVSRQPGRFHREVRLAWAKMLAGEPGPLLMAKPPQYYFSLDLESPRDAYILKAHGYFTLGRFKEARRFLGYALSIADPDFDRIRRGGGADKFRGSPSLEKLHYSSDEFASAVDELLRSRPARERLAFMGELITLEPAYSSFWLKQAFLAIKIKNFDLARKSLEKAMSLDPVRFESRRAERLYEEWVTVQVSQRLAPPNRKISPP